MAPFFPGSSHEEFSAGPEEPAQGSQSEQGAAAGGSDDVTVAAVKRAESRGQKTKARPPKTEKPGLDQIFRWS